MNFKFTLLDFDTNKNELLDDEKKVTILNYKVDQVKPKNLNDSNKQIEELLNVIEKDLITMTATIDKKNTIKRLSQIIKVTKMEYQKLAAENREVLSENLELSEKQKS